KHTDASRTVQPRFEHLFGGKELNMAGMMPRPVVESILPNSAAKDQLVPGDVVLSVSVGSDRTDNPTSEQLRDRLGKAGEGHSKVSLVVLRDGKKVTVEGLEPNITVDKEKGRRGLGINLIYDDQHAVVAGVAKDSPAEAARIPAGVTITSIAGQPVRSWFDVQRLLGQAVPDQPVSITYVGDAGEATTTIRLD